MLKNSFYQATVLAEKATVSITSLPDFLQQQGELLDVADLGMPIPRQDLKAFKETAGPYVHKDIHNSVSGSDRATKRSAVRSLRKVKPVLKAYSGAKQVAKADGLKMIDWESEFLGERGVSVSAFYRWLACQKKLNGFREFAGKFGEC